MWSGFFFPPSAFLVEVDSKAGGELQKFSNVGIGMLSVPRHLRLFVSKFSSFANSKGLIFCNCHLGNSTKLGGSNALQQSCNWGVADSSTWCWGWNDTTALTTFKGFLPAFVTSTCLLCSSPQTPVYKSALLVYLLRHSILPPTNVLFMALLITGWLM